MTDYADFAADAFAAFAAAGTIMGTHEGTYTAAGGGAAVDCLVVLDLSVENIGDFGAVSGYSDQVELLRSQVTPTRGGTIVAGGASYVLEERLADDGTLSRWSVRRA